MEVLAAEGTRIVFLGDSFELNWSAGPGTGKSVWNDYFAKHCLINQRNYGGITPVMLYRVRNGNLTFPEDQHTKIAVLLCGTNNFVVSQSAGGSVKWDLGEACPPEDIAHGIREIAQEFRNRLPQTRLIIMGILPFAHDVNRAKCRQVNDHLPRIRLDNDDLVFVDLWDKFMNPDGSLNRELFTERTCLT